MNIFIPLQKFNLKPILFLFQTLAIQIETIPSNNTIIYNPPLLLVFIHLLQSVSKKKKEKRKKRNLLGHLFPARRARRNCSSSASPVAPKCISPRLRVYWPRRHPLVALPPLSSACNAPLLSSPPPSTRRRHPRAASWPEVADDNEPPLPPQQQPLSTTPPDPAPIKPSATPPPPPPLAIDTARRRRRRGQVDGGEDAMDRCHPFSFSISFCAFFLFFQSIRRFFYGERCASKIILEEWCIVSTFSRVIHKREEGEDGFLVFFSSIDSVFHEERLAWFNRK